MLYQFFVYSFVLMPGPLLTMGERKGVDVDVTRQCCVPRLESLAEHLTYIQPWIHKKIDNVLETFRTPISLMR